MDKLISIIVPCYNVEKYIDRCFKSLEGQSIGVEKLELIFVDDCSTDGTWACLEKIEQQCPESVMIIHLEENGRQGRARNIGMQYASAPFVGFVDADDWVEPDMYEKLYDKMKKHNCDIVMCDSWRDPGRADYPLQPKRNPEKEDRNILIDTVEKRRILLASSLMGFCVWNKLYRAELLQENALFFPEELAYEDHFFATLLYFYVKRLYILEERLYHYYVNENSTVMAAGAAHHMDILQVDTLLWDECEQRGLLEQYRQEMEYQFLSLCYLTSVKMMIIRLQEVPYPFFQVLKQEVLQRVPNYHVNPYVAELVTDVYKIVLELLDKECSEAELNALFDALRAYVKQGKISM